MSDLYIVDQPALVDFCASLHGTPWLALDTEFLREQTFYPQLCLIQIAVPGQVACIDPLALPSLDPLLDLLCDPAITKVLHAAHQDLETLFHLRGAVPSPVFDTQLAALVLGYGHQIGYAALVKQQLGVDLAKAHTRADWRQRPLAPEWLAYAADDVRYLVELYPQQRAALQERGWLAALAEDFQSLCHPNRYRLQPNESWWRIRDQRRLGGMERAVLRALAAWREKQASVHDRPRRWILEDAVLVELSRRMPTTLDELQRIRGLPAATRQRHGETLLARIAAARTEPPDQWPEPLQKRRLEMGQSRYVNEALARIAVRANQYGIPSEVIAHQRDVEDLLAHADSPLRHGWRSVVIGQELLAQIDMHANF